MKKQKKKRNKTRSFQTVNLTQTQLRNRWILASIGFTVLFLLMIIFLVFFFVGKVNVPGLPKFADSTSADSTQGSSDLQKQIEEYKNQYNNYNFDELYQLQISKPKEGEEIAEIYFAGMEKPVKARLFEDEAPEIVKQFKALVKKGYYDKSDFMVDTKKTISTNIFDEKINWEPESMSGGTFDTESQSELLKNMESWETLEIKSYKILPYNGALCAYERVLDNKSYGVNFFVMISDSTYSEDLTELNLPNQLKNLFKKHGGDLTYSFGSSYKSEYSNENLQANLLDYLKHPTFGQIFEGMETIEKMAEELKDYEINKIVISKYKE